MKNVKNITPPSSYTDSPHEIIKETKEISISEKLKTKYKIRNSKSKLFKRDSKEKIDEFTSKKEVIF